MTDTQRQIATIAFYSFAGGFADATSFSTFKTFTGHVTGNLVLLALSLAKGEWNGVFIRVVAIACFLASTSLGFRLALLRRASVWLLCFQVALLLPITLLGSTSGVATVLGTAAFCCSLGLQNGVVTKTLGVSVHSTFVSGDFTSLLKTGTRHALTGARSYSQKSQTKAVLATLILAFALGAFAAGLLSHFSPKAAPIFLLVPLCVAMLLQTSAGVPTSPNAH